MLLLYIYYATVWYTKWNIKSTPNAYHKYKTHVKSNTLFDRKCTLSIIWMSFIAMQSMHKTVQNSPWKWESF